MCLLAFRAYQLGRLRPVSNTHDPVPGLDALSGPRAGDRISTPMARAQSTIPDLIQASASIIAVELDAHAFSTLTIGFPATPRRFRTLWPVALPAATLPQKLAWMSAGWSPA